MSIVSRPGYITCFWTRGCFDIWSSYSIASI